MPSRKLNLEDGVKLVVRIQPEVIIPKGLNAKGITWNVKSMRERRASTIGKVEKETL